MPRVSPCSAAHDVRLYLADGSFATPDELRALVDEIPHRDAVIATGERLVVPTRVDASAGGQTIVVPGRLVGMETGDPSVDALMVKAGRGLATGDDGQPVAELEYHFAAHYDLPIPMSIGIADGQPARRGRSMPTRRTTSWSSRPSATSWPRPTTPSSSSRSRRPDRSPDSRGMANELVVRLSDPSLASIVRDELQAAAADEAAATWAPRRSPAATEVSRRWVDRDAAERPEPLQHLRHPDAGRSHLRRLQPDHPHRRVAAPPDRHRPGPGPARPDSGHPTAGRGR